MTGYRVEYVGLDPVINKLKGTVVEDISTKFAKVEFDGGLIFTVKKINLVKINESEDNNMAKLEGYYAVAVIEEGTGYCKKDYYYAVFDDGNTYKAGDQVLVSGCNKDVLTIKEILTVPEAEVKCNKNITAEIICRVDTSAYDQRIENRKKAEKLKKDMDAVIKQMDVTKKYEMYAAENPELAALLDQYKELTK